MPKTATIKLRLSEDEKLNWEAQATADGVSLSSLIRHRMNHPTTRADGGLVPAPKIVEVIGRTVDGQFVRPDGSGFTAETSGPLDAFPLAVARRTTECEHGRPQYVFCPTCDQ